MSKSVIMENLIGYFEEKLQRKLKVEELDVLWKAQEKLSPVLEEGLANRS
ncbi:hypothetical protein [Halalkalibacter wakoensis]|nr:hypothetical protein [Halalkalibacter wakoensis]